MVFTAWKVSVFGVFLVYIFPHFDWIWRDTLYLSVFSPNAGKYGPERPWIWILFTQWFPIAKMQNNRYKGLKKVLITEAYSELSRRTVMDIFVNIVSRKAPSQMLDKVLVMPLNYQWHIHHIRWFIFISWANLNIVNWVSRLLLNFFFWICKIRILYFLNIGTGFTGLLLTKSFTFPPSDLQVSKNANFFWSYSFILNKIYNKITCVCCKCLI